MQVRYPVFVVLCSSYHATVFRFVHGCCCRCCILASCCCIGCGFGTSTFGTSFVTDICVFVFFSSLLLFWRVLVLAFRIFVFYIILKKRVVDRGCAVALAGKCTVPGSVFSLSVFTGAFCFCFCFRGFCVSTTSVEKSLACRKKLSQL
jgi:hypothetical protein